MAKIPLEFELESVVEDIETLNSKALNGIYDVTAISLHAYAFVSDKYRILSTGASVGEGYGPVVVAREKNVDPNKATIAIPGRLTTAALLLKLFCNAKTVEMRFDEILNAIVSGKVDAGLLIHEAQLSYEDYGLKKIMDFFELWNSITDLPLPLGVNVIERNIEIGVQRSFLRAMRMSVEYAIENFEEALDYAKMFSRGLETGKLAEFVRMYVSSYTIEMPKKVEKAIETLFELAESRGLLKKPLLDVLR